MAEKLESWFQLQKYFYLALSNVRDLGTLWPGSRRQDQKSFDAAVQNADAYADIVATAREPLMVLGSDLRVKTANQSFYQTFKVVPEETEGTLIYDLGNRQWNIPGLRTLLEQIIPHNSRFHDFEVVHEFEGVGRRTMLLNAHRFCRQNTHEMILLAIEDVTEQRRARDALEASEARYRRLFETAQDAILILDAETGQIQDANPFLIDLLGYSLDDLSGKQLWQIGVFKDIEANRFAFKELQQKGYIRYKHLPLQTKQGKPVAVEFVSNIYDVADTRVIQCNIRDITEQTQAEEALREADRHKNEFLAMLAHELRNPLAPILNAVFVLEKALKPETDGKVNAAGEIIKRQVHQMTRLIDDLLDISRITLGKIHLQKQPLLISTVVARAVEMSRPMIESGNHNFEVILPEDAIRVEADSERLTQVLSNLLNNAAKYTPDSGHIWLEVKKDEGMAVIRVRDTGMGIPPEKLSGIFELFVQIESTLKRCQDGLGVGLTLARALVNLHGGTLQASSEGLGKGSEFVVRLPLRHDMVKTIPHVEGRDVSEAAHRRPRRILVVDDNKDAADSMRLLLDLYGHVVRISFDGPSAIKTAESFNPEVVLMDIGLPGMNGYEAAKRMRTLPGLRNALLVALTGFGAEEDRRSSSEAGFDYHLLKPLDSHALLKLLDTSVP
ncbi:MAG TPA: ATP-binding protein [Acidobacteriota bacterium]